MRRLAIASIVVGVLGTGAAVAQPAGAPPQPELKPPVVQMIERANAGEIEGIR